MVKRYRQFKTNGGYVVLNWGIHQGVSPFTSSFPVLITAIGTRHKPGTFMHFFDQNNNSFGNWPEMAGVDNQTSKHTGERKTLRRNCDP